MRFLLCDFSSSATIPQYHQNQFRYPWQQSNPTWHSCVNFAKMWPACGRNRSNYSHYLDPSGKPVTETPKIELGREANPLGDDRYRILAVAKAMCPPELELPNIGFPLREHKQKRTKTGVHI